MHAHTAQQAASEQQQVAWHSVLRVGLEYKVYRALDFSAQSLQRATVPVLSPVLEEADITVVPNTLFRIKNLSKLQRRKRTSIEHKEVDPFAADPRGRRAQPREPHAPLRDRHGRRRRLFDAARRRRSVVTVETPAPAAARCPPGRPRRLLLGTAQTALPGDHLAAAALRAAKDPRVSQVSQGSQGSQGSQYLKSCVRFVNSFQIPKSLSLSLSLSCEFSKRQRCVSLFGRGLGDPAVSSWLEKSCVSSVALSLSLSIFENTPGGIVGPQLWNNASLSKERSMVRLF